MESTQPSPSTLLFQPKLLQGLPPHANPESRRSVPFPGPVAITLRFIVNLMLLHDISMKAVENHEENEARNDQGSNHRSPFLKALAERRPLNGLKPKEQKVAT